MVGHYDYFLIRIDENEDYEIENKNKHEVLDFLYERGFKYITGGSCPWLFIDIINKEFYVGKAGVKFGRVVGEHAITFKEFKSIYNIYEKYNGLGPIEMPKNNHRKEIERKELFEKYGLKTTKLKKQGAVVIIRGTSTIKTEPLTEEQKK